MNEGCSWNHSLSHLGLGIWNDAEFQISPSSKHSSLLLRIKAEMNEKIKPLEEISTSVSVEIPKQPKKRKSDGGRRLMKR